ncbi:MAG: SurA N-terminal domain-containing protein [Rickettsiales bacterium]|jgi:peptidyl-prolyl cis-trans isomerase SurA|nr:SurA N-terminal domain-containing protein [Rickettsiales bacterium]
MMQKKTFAKLLFALALALSSPCLAAESRIAAVVNGEIITSYELDGRVSFTRSLMKGAKPPAGLRGKILEEMVNDRLKLAEASKFGVKVEDAEIDETVRRMEDFYGVKIDKSLAWVRGQAKADVAWNKFVFGYLRSLVGVRDGEIDGVIGDYSSRKAYEYSLVPLLADRKRLDDLAPEARKVSSCSGFKAFAAKHGAAGSGAEIKVGEADMSPALAAEVAALGESGLSSPVEGAGGPAMFYLCSRKETGKPALPPPDRAKVRQDLFMGKLESLSQRHFGKLRAGAAVEIRE